MPDEFRELQQSCVEQEQADEGGVGGMGGKLGGGQGSDCSIPRAVRAEAAPESDQQQQQQQQQQPAAQQQNAPAMQAAGCKLLLGRDVLSQDHDFAELVSLTLIQVGRCGACSW